MTALSKYVHTEAVQTPSETQQMRPVNIRNIFKWFKPLQNVFKTYLYPILNLFIPYLKVFLTFPSKHLHCNV